LNDDLEPGRYRFLLPTIPGAEKYWEAGPALCLDVQ
jgi:hypothetical protein